MIEIINGNLFDSSCDAYVNCINCSGIMGTGIAKNFKQKFPEMFVEYQIACKARRVQIGKMHVVRRLFSPFWLINFPTKGDWRNPSKLTWIAQGLNSLVEEIDKNNIKSIAIPALGCQNGGLNFETQVLPLMLDKLSPLADVHIEIFYPLYLF